MDQLSLVLDELTRTVAELSEAGSGENCQMAYARRVLAAQRRWIERFGSGAAVFCDPSLVILLDLYVQRERSQGLPMISLCIGAGVPATTGLRCIAQLGARGLVHRVVHPDDRRSKMVCLTEKAVEVIERGLARKG